MVSTGQPSVLDFTAGWGRYKACQICD